MQKIAHYFLYYLNNDQKVIAVLGAFSLIHTQFFIPFRCYFCERCIVCIPFNFLWKPDDSEAAAATSVLKPEIF